jgi:hypothetical protein
MMGERGGDAGNTAGQSLAQHGAQPAKRRQLAQEERGDGGSAAASDLARDGTRLTGGVSHRLLDQDRAARARGLHAQRGTLVGGCADEQGVSAPDRGLGTLDRRPGDGDRDRRPIPVSHGGQEQVRLAGEHAQHIGA